MNMKQKIAGIAFVTLGAAGLFSACGLEPGAEDCTFDRDCGDGYLCHDTVCTPSCETQDDCVEGETCSERPGGAEGMVCVADDTNNDNQCDPACEDGFVCVDGTCVEDDGPECTSDEQCEDGFECDLDLQQCFPEQAGATYQVIQVLDETDDESACGSTDPGSDIMYVYVQASDGTIRGFAEVVDYVQGAGDSNNHTNFSHIDGSAPDFDYGNFECPTFSGNALTLGCEGYILVRFLGDDGTPLTLDAGDEVVVGEYGQNDDALGTCGSDPRDWYSVSLCTDTQAALNDFDANSCTHALGMFNSGVNAAEVTFPSE